MDMSELAKMMLQWEQLQRRADELKKAIEDTVLQIGRTQTVGNVRASFSKGRTTYDYEAMAAWFHPSPEFVAEYTKPVTDWRALVKFFESDTGGKVPEVVKSETGPSVSVKLLEV